jgi:hypothetical protein
MLNTIATAINCQMNSGYMDGLTGQNDLAYGYTDNTYNGYNNSNAYSTSNANNGYTNYQNYDYSNYGYTGDTSEYGNVVYGYDDPNYANCAGYTNNADYSNTVAYQQYDQSHHYQGYVPIKQVSVTNEQVFKSSFVKEDIEQHVEDKLIDIVLNDKRLKVMADRKRIHFLKKKKPKRKGKVKTKANIEKN